MMFFGDSVPTWNDHMTHGTYGDYWKATQRLYHSARWPSYVAITFAQPR